VEAWIGTRTETEAGIETFHDKNFQTDQELIELIETKYPEEQCGPH
jgi:hypothetical protein